MKKARIKYHEEYNGKEGYTVEIMTDDEGWGLESFFPLLYRNEDSEERTLVHYSILNKIHNLKELGYSIIVL